ncbi:hypothetical protein BDN72DRAFT_844835 [Pluteus cervinus]|uniref:Uncharacterized protein n=1 Tax=Pluteus cervinus TaxID=181527 RepID=A0ACD3AKE6_9AGAR|nr:hypothetical protein BDN72DRAFT_844835 [Pluteus cervinus]
MPAIRRPLRERCNVQLQVTPPPPTKPVDDLSIEADDKSHRRNRSYTRPNRSIRETLNPYARPQKDATAVATDVVKEAAANASVKVDSKSSNPPVESLNKIEETQEEENPRVSNVKKGAEVEEELEAKEEEEDTQEKPDEYARPSMDPTKARITPEYERAATIALDQMHELVPYVHLAFSDGAYNPSSVTTKSGCAFTHIVKMLQPSTSRIAGTTSLEFDPETMTHVLRLVLCKPKPRRARRRSICERNTPLLNEHQLLIARDFLALALPYYSQNDDLEAPPVHGDTVHTLITAPINEGYGAVDIMSLATCYLAHCSGEDIFTVLRYISEEEEVPEVWKGVIGVCKDGTGLISDVANMPL